MSTTEAPSLQSLGPGDRWLNAYCKLREALGGLDPVEFNDTHTHAEVLAACKRAGI